MIRAAFYRSSSSTSSLLQQRRGWKGSLCVFKASSGTSNSAPPAYRLCLWTLPFRHWSYRCRILYISPLQSHKQDHRVQATSYTSQGRRDHGDHAQPSNDVERLRFVIHTKRRPPMLVSSTSTFVATQDNTTIARARRCPVEAPMQPSNHQPISQRDAPTLSAAPAAPAARVSMTYRAASVRSIQCAAAATAGLLGVSAGYLGKHRTTKHGKTRCPKRIEKDEEEKDLPAHRWSRYRAQETPKESGIIDREAATPPPQPNTLLLGRCPIPSTQTPPS